MLFRSKVDTSKFERRDWIGHGGTFFFSWLAFWILFLNVPFVDVTPPVIEGVTVNWGTGDVPITTADVQSGPHNTSGAATFNVSATIQENSILAGVQFTVGGAQVTPQRVGASRYSAERPLVITAYDVVIFATDATGHSATFSFKLAFSG